MKIALASASVQNGDVAHNLTQMAKYISQAREQGAELVCFGEAYLQGFHSLTWDFEADQNMALSYRAALFHIIAGWTMDSGMDVLFGFMERDGDQIYSSCALVSGGVLLQLYRRVSPGWKDCEKADGHYREGTEAATFTYRGKRCQIALCGDPTGCRSDLLAGLSGLFQRSVGEHCPAGVCTKSGFVLRSGADGQFH